MKKIVLTLAGFMIALLSIAQSPNLMNYQGVARNAAGNVLPNQPIALRLSILNGSVTGAAVYSETRAVTTNAFGLFNVVVGSPGAITSTGTVAGINWSAFGTGSGSKFLQVEIDPVGGTNFVNLGATQLVSVPYALNAGSSAPVGPAGGDLTGTYPNPTVAKLQGRNVSAAAPANKNLLMWDATTTSWIPATAVQAGVVSGTGVLNMIPKWTPDGFSLGNSQLFDNGTNVGVNTLTPTGKFEVQNAGTNVSLLINNSNAANVSNTVTIDNANISSVAFSNGSLLARRGAISANTFLYINVPSAASGISSGGIGLQGTSENVIGVAGLTFSGVGMQAVAVGTGTSLVATTAGTGVSANINNTNAANISNTMLVDNANLTSVAFGNGNILARRGAISANTFLYINVPSAISGISSTGNGVQGSSETQFGVAGLTFSGVGVNAVAVGAGTALFAQNAGTGLVADMNNTSAANINNVIRAVNLNPTAAQTNSNTGGGNTIFARKGTGLGTSITSPSAVYGTSSAANGIGILGLTLTNIANFGGAITTGTGVLGQTFGAGGAALVGNGSSSATSLGLVTLGGVQIQGLGAAAGRVLTSDAVGNATWQVPAGRSVGISMRGFPAALVVPTAVFTPITQWAVIDNEDGGANYNNTTGEYTIPVTGVYQVNCSIAWAPGMVSADTRIEMELDAVHEFSTLDQAAGAGYTNQKFSYSKRFTAGQKIRLLLLQTSGSNQSTLGFAAENSLSIQYLHN